MKRGVEGYEIRAPHDKSLVETQPYKGKQRTWDKDGLTLLFIDGGTALRMVVLSGDRSQPSERDVPSPAWAWYLLAPGETYAARVNGVVINEF